MKQSVLWNFIHQVLSFNAKIPGKVRFGKKTADSVINQLSFFVDMFIYNLQCDEA